MIQLLTNEERESLHLRYRNSDLFRHWMPLLSQMESFQGELDALMLWKLSENLIERLRSTSTNREEMIPFLFANLLKELKTVVTENNTTIVRTDLQAERSAVTVMTILLTQLANAAEKGQEEGDYDNYPMCVEIANIVRNHPQFKILLEHLFGRKLDNRGKKVVITPADPMNIEDMLAQMDAKAIEEMDAMYEKLLQITTGMKTLLEDDWKLWETMCKAVCQDVNLLQLLRERRPKYKNEWGLNQKMVCNMIGILHACLNGKVSVNALRTAITKKSVNNYIYNHAAYGTTDCELSRQQHEKIKGMISSKQS